MEFHWVSGFTLDVRTDGKSTVISGNRAGLLSLANHLLTLADEIPGHDFHLDEYNSLEDGSSELVFCKLP